MTSTHDNQDSRTLSADVEVRADEATSHRNSERRKALSLTMVGGLAALLAACGKYVTKYDQSAANKLKSGGPADKLPGEGTTSSTGSGDATGDGPGGSGSGGPGGGVTAVVPGTCTPEKKPSVNLTPVASVNKDSVLDVVPALYGIKSSSSLLALRFKAGEVVAGDIVHLLRKTSATTGELLATRRIQPVVDFDPNASSKAQLVFEALKFGGAMELEVLLMRGGMPLKRFSIGVAEADYKRTFNGSDVVDMSAAVAGTSNLSGIFSSGNVPKMTNTSNITSGVGSGIGTQNGTNQAYTAALSSSTWDLSALLPGTLNTDVFIRDVFDQPLNVGTVSASNLFAQTNTFVVYVKKSIGGAPKYVRYFYFIG